MATITEDLNIHPPSTTHGWRMDEGADSLAWKPCGEKCTRQEPPHQGKKCAKHRKMVPLTHPHASETELACGMLLNQKLNQKPLTWNREWLQNSVGIQVKRQPVLYYLLYYLGRSTSAHAGLWDVVANSILSVWDGAAKAAQPSKSTTCGEGNWLDSTCNRDGKTLSPEGPHRSSRRGGEQRGFGWLRNQPGTSFGKPLMSVTSTTDLKAGPAQRNVFMMHVRGTGFVWHSKR